MISQLLKLASEDKECEEKLAFVYDAMEDKDVGQEISDEVEYLLGEVGESLEKRAGIFDSLKGGISSIGGAAKGVAGAAKPYAGAAALGAASLVGSALVNDMYTSARLALSRNRNYKNMLEADPELKQHPAEKVKALFNTLHEKGGPEMSGDPLIASAFVKQQLELPPQFLLEQVHKLVGTGAALNKSRQMGSFDLGRLMDAGRPKEKTPNVTNNYNYPSQSNNCPNCGASPQNFNVTGVAHGVSLKECMSCGHLF